MVAQGAMSSAPVAARTGISPPSDSMAWVTTSFGGRRGTTGSTAETGTTSLTPASSDVVARTTQGTTFCTAATGTTPSSRATSATTRSGAETARTHCTGSAGTT